ncbi:MAG: DNA primase [Dehalococcoidia bacterium]
MSEVEEIKSRLDIVDLISEHVNLTQSGRNYKANCPFHSERTPSFIVDPSRQLWRCFGSCATGGDVFSFLMKVEGIEFPEALKILGERTGIEISRNSSAVLKDDYYQINEIAKNFYKSNLTSDEGQIALDYLESRGIDLKKIDSFDLGYSLIDRDSLKNHLSFHHVDFEKAIESGLLTKFDNGNVKDFFVARLMFPISDRNGRVVGFGARSLDDSMPKYINTPSSPVFDKKNILYALHLAKDSIRKKNEVVVVEGYMDVIAAHEYSFKNVVASMGTALTVEQVRQIKNLASSYVLALDQDTAGQEATLRSLQSSWGIFESLNTSKNDFFSDYSKILKVLSIPNGKDPDEFIRSESQDWGRIVADALPLMDYLIPSLISRFDVNVPGNSQKF